MNFAIFGAGCFWCIEAIFSQLDGVSQVISGYSGGDIKNPTYEEVCSGKTNHAEVCKIEYNPEIITFETLLKVFWENHDPTTLNKQGADIGTQYRSAIFYTNLNQKEISEKYKDNLNKSNAFINPIVTEIVEFKEFYRAEKHHQDYFANNQNLPYCQIVIKPKLDKFMQSSFYQEHKNR